MDTRDILTIKGLIRRGEARTACTYNNIPLDHCHFLDLPFYETGKIQEEPHQRSRCGNRTQPVA